MTFERFTNEVMSILEMATLIGVVYEVYLHLGKSIFFTILVWILIVVLHGLQLMFEIDGNIYDDKQVKDALAKLNPWWFALNSFVMIGLSNI